MAGPIGHLLLLAHVDESYRDINDKFIMAAVVTDELQAQALTAELDRIVDEITLNRGMSKHAELHGNEIWHGNGLWSQLDGDPDLQIALMENCVDAITANSSQLIWRTINVPDHRAIGYPTIFPPDVVCFQHLLERIEKFAVHEQTYALVVCDEVADPNAPRKMLRQYRESGTPGYIATPLPHILDTIHFAPSDHSRLLQAADIVAYIVCLRTYLSSLHVRVQPVVESLYDRLTTQGRAWYNGSWP